MKNSSNTSVASSNSSDGEISLSASPKLPNNIANDLIHYKNIFSAPQQITKRRVDYSKMKIYNAKYRKESERLQSLRNSNVLPENLLSSMAKTGLYYKENPAILDQVSCIYCQGILSGWKKNDVPSKRHKFNYPTCPFVINLNVGNEPLEYDEYKSSIDDCNGITSLLELNSTTTRPSIETGEIFLDEINKLDLDFREKTFFDYPHLKDFAFEGLYIIHKNLSALLKCCSCKKEMEILRGIENLDSDLMHRNNCDYRNIYQTIEKETQVSSDLSNDFCEVEYSISSEEVEARMETRSICQLLKTGVDREAVRSVVQHRLKSKGRDFDSEFELRYELNKGVKYEEKKRTSSDLDIILKDFPCAVCLDKPVAVIFIPCGHLKSCESCSDMVVSCPVCRMHIDKRVKRFRFKS